MTVQTYADLLVQAYGHSIALKLAKAEAGGHDDHDGYWTKVVLAIKQRVK